MKIEKNDKKINNMTEGSPIKLIFAFAIPMLIGNVFQQLYNMVDSIVVGNYVGKTALAAVGTGFPIIFFIVSIFIGLGVGSTILISQYYGANDIDGVTRTSRTIYTAMIIGSIPLSLIGITFCGPMLKLMNVPADTFLLAKKYMTIIFAGLIGTLGFNVNAGILQGLGDSKSSLLFLSIACVINVVLDLVFVLIVPWGVAGVAYATIIAQFFSWGFGIIYMRRKYEFFRFPILKFNFDKDIFLKVLKLGIPSSIQNTVFSLGIISLQSLVNSYGSDFMAGFNAANKIDTFAFMPIQSFANAATTFVGQNVGAKKFDRVHKGTVSTIILSITFSVVLGAIILPLGPSMMKLFNPDPVVIESGMVYLKTVVPFFALLSLVFVLSGVMRGAGESIIPMIGSIVSLWIGRVPSAYLLAKYAGRDYIFYSYVIGWLLWFIVAVPYYISGKWKTKSENLLNKSKEFV